MHFSREQRLGRVATMLLFCVCLFVMAACAGDDTGTPISTLPIPVAGQKVSVTLQTLTMLNDKSGWAITHDGHILHTLTGPASWQDVTPSINISGTSMQPTLQSSYFLNENYGWLVTAEDSKLSVWSTYDGGGSWSETPLGVPATSAISIRFDDAWNGWLLLNNGVNGTNQAVSLLQSIDGGATWAPQDNADNTTADMAGHLPFSGQKSGITFSDGSHGWLTGNLTNSNGQSLPIYRSQDGGYSWNTQMLSAPETIATAKGLISLPPTFFDANNGIMPVYKPAPAGEVAIYTTRDGGNTWVTTRPDSTIAPTVSFVDTQHGWAIGDSKHASAIYSTADAGKSWQQLGKPPVKISKVDAIDFVSPTDGWMLGLNTAENDQLFQTRDGGKTWSTINPRASM